jgi:NAD(P)H dehydrogenase (quinone)
VTLGITGASGQLGRLTTQALLERVDPSDVVLITRDPARLADAGGAAVRHGDFAAPETLEAAFAGIERLLLISTDVIDQRLPGHLAAIEAARRAGVRHGLYTSIVNPVEANRAAATASHRETERALRESGLDWTFLRNALYAEFQLADAAAAIASGRLVHNRGDGAHAYVSREDCAAAAAAVLAGAGEPNTAYDITGPEAVSGADMAALLSELGGRPVEAVAVDDEAFVAGLQEHAGLPEPVARSIATFGAATREGHLEGVSGAVRDLTGRAPRSLREVLEAHRDEVFAYAQ